MSAGTINLINNTKTVSGKGTFFSQDIKVGDCLVVTVGQVPYTLAVENVISDISLQLVQPYDGPEADALAWQVVPLGTMVRVASQLLQQVAYATRGYNLDKANWQKVFSDKSPVTVNLPDGTSYTGPSWVDIADEIAKKADKKEFDEFNKKLSEKADKCSLDVFNEKLTEKADINVIDSKAAAGLNADITSLTGLKTPLSVSQGGTGAQSGPNACNNIGAFPTTGGKIYGSLTTDGDIHGSNIYSNRGTFNSQAASDTANAHFWMRGSGAVSRAVLYSNRNGQAFIRVDDEASNTTGYQFVMNKAGVFQCASLTQTSDKRIKSDQRQVVGALDKLSKLTGYTYNLRVTKETIVRGAGVIAQDVEGVLPEAVTTIGKGIASDGSPIEAVKGVDYSALAALYVEAFKELNDRIIILEKSLHP